MVAANTSLEAAAAEFRRALAELERAALREVLEAPRPGLADLAKACSATRAAFAASSETTATMAAAGAVLRGMDEGRKAAHANRRAEGARIDAEMRRRWALYARSGWRDVEILEALAERDGLKRETVRKRARRLRLLRDA